MTKSIIASSASIICRLATHYKIDPEPLFSAAGLDFNLRRDANARYDSDALNKVWQMVADQIGHPCFGLKSAGLWHPSDLHALGYAWLASASIHSAFERLCRYTRIVSDTDDFIFRDTKDTTSISANFRGLSSDVLWAADSTLVIIMSMCRINYGANLDPVSVQFIHPEPVCSSEYFEYFRCPVKFNAKNNSIAFSSEVVHEHLSGANAMLAQVNDRMMIEYLARLDKNDVVQRVKAAIIHHLPSGRVTDTIIASDLNRNERTLQRQLKKEGTTFKTLLNEIRIELASKYILDSQLSLTEISFMLGFSEMSSFSRAFKRWLGKSPTDYRQQSL